MRRIMLAALMAAFTASVSPVQAATVGEDVFSADLMRQIKEPRLLRYRYEMSGHTLPDPYRSHVAMDVREVGGDGAKAVFFDMFEGENRRQFGPMASREQNPLVIVFLQRDVSQMSNLTGGAATYFQQQIRRAFNEPAESEAVEVEVDGRTVPATRLTILPFRNDPHIDRFPRFKDKTYEFVVTPEVPGGLYRIATRTPDPESGRIIIEESMTFEDAAP